MKKSEILIRAVAALDRFEEAVEADVLQKEVGSSLAEEARLEQLRSAEKERLKELITLLAK